MLEIIYFFVLVLLYGFSYKNITKEIGMATEAEHYYNNLHLLKKG